MLRVDYERPDEPSTVHLRRKEVVVVDRDIVRGERIRGALEPCGFGVRLCAAPLWAPDVFEDKPTDLVVVSTSVGTDAIELILRTLRDRAKVRSIVLLDPSDRGSDSEWRLMGFAGALRQPLSMDALVDEVTGLLGRPWCDSRED